jgi:hypothetical protein
VESGVLEDMPENLHSNDGASERLAALRDSVQRVFPPVVYQGQVTRFDGEWLPELTEENALLDDDKFLYEALLGRQWTEVPKDFIYAMAGDFVLLTDEALVAFLPAWIMCSFENITGENRVRDTFVYSFSPEEQPPLRDALLSRLRALNPDQRSLVRSLLVEFAHLEPDGFVGERASAGVKFIDDNF